MLYKCRRCGYTSDIKGNLKNHLRRKNICKPILENISIETLMSELDEICAQSALKCAGNALKCAQIDKKCAEGALGCAGNALKCAQSALAIEIDENTSICSSNDSLYSNDTPLLQCIHCKKTFKHKRYLKQHHRRNNCKAKNFNEEFAIIKKDLNKDQKIDKLEKQVMHLMEQNSKLINNVGSNNTINNTTNNTHIENQQINIQINNCGYN